MNWEGVMASIPKHHRKVRTKKERHCSAIPAASRVQWYSHANLPHICGRRNSKPVPQSADFRETATSLEDKFDIRRINITCIEPLHEREATRISRTCLPQSASLLPRDSLHNHTPSLQCIEQGSSCGHCEAPNHARPPLRIRDCCQPLPRANACSGVANSRRHCWMACVRR